VSQIDGNPVLVAFYGQASGRHEVLRLQSQINPLTSLATSDPGLYLLLGQIYTNLLSKV